MFKKGDIIVYILLTAVISGILYYSFSKKNENGGKVEVYIDNKLSYVYDLTKEKHVYEIAEPLGKGIMVIENYNVIKTDSACANKICVKHGAISKVGEMIICVPNKSVIKIAGQEEVDGILK